MKGVMQIVLVACVACVGFGCGGAATEATDDIASTQQPLYYGACEIDEYGYQTGRCISSLTCTLAPPQYQQCTPGVWGGPRGGECPNTNVNRCLASPAQ
jgi:hypothetical protein